MNDTINWLLGGEPWVEYRTRLDLLGQSRQDQSVIDAKSRMISHPQIQGLFHDLDNWGGQLVSSHRNAELPLHKLAFIADIGLTVNDPEIKRIIDLITEHKDDHGVFQVVMNIPEHFGGTGENTWAWALCDAPIVLYSLVRFGLGHEPPVLEAIKFLTSLARDNGWGCIVSPELGKFRGPGRKDDPCPYATLLMLKLLSQAGGSKSGRESRVGAEALLDLWKKSRESHPYMFYMGTDFRKLKAPAMWYDIVSVADVLSQFEWLISDPGLNEMVGIISSKADGSGRFTPESEYRAYKGWDFGQKKEPSRWLTFLVLRILKRMEAVR
ncbi:MAG: hypothetical protein Q8O09_02080 [Bacillota bacterium]|nr:hypothetical protein [Bacillota bacterium]